VTIRRRLLALRPALLSDALGKAGAMDHDMRCWSANCRMAGPAVTLRVHTADILMVGHRRREGDRPVVDRGHIHLDMCHGGCPPPIHDGEGQGDLLVAILNR